MEANVMIQPGANPVNPAARQPVASGTPVQTAATPELPQASASSAPSVRLDISNRGITLSALPSDDRTEPVAFSPEEISEARIAAYVNEANRALEASNFRLNHDVHEATNTVMVQVVDSDTNEVLRELPPESRLDAIAKMLELAGLLFDETS